MNARRVILMAILVAAGCKQAGGDAEGLPQAESWQAPDPVPSLVGAGSNGSPHAGTDMNNPHAGMNMNNPHAGMDMSNPHAGMDMSNPHAGMDMSNPHAGMGSVGDTGMQPPDPDRPVDPSQFLDGTIVAGAKTKGLVKPGSVMFLSARPVNPTTGEVIGAPLAVDRIDVTQLPVSFHLSGANSMVAGTVFEGTVKIVARIDGDAEARTRLSGDLEGTLQATIPAKNLKLVLDTVVE
jgi:hypothetical protein